MTKLPANVSNKNKIRWSLDELHVNIDECRDKISHAHRWRLQEELEAKFSKRQSIWIHVGILVEEAVVASLRVLRSHNGYLMILKTIIWWERIYVFNENLDSWRNSSLKCGFSASFLSRISNSVLQQMGNFLTGSSSQSSCPLLLTLLLTDHLSSISCYVAAAL